MKKIYIQPQAEIINVQPQQLLATSGVFSTDGSNLMIVVGEGEGNFEDGTIN